jgi:aerobic-type carbon monoxide dehydrogenase small subunit (CoxS/CutS family)
MRLTVNGKPVDVAAEPDHSLLWVIRERLMPERVLAALRERA